LFIFKKVLFYILLICNYKIIQFLYQKGDRYETDYLLAFICALLIPVLIGCQSEPKALTVDEINKEKQAIVQVIENYNRASERKNFAELVNTLADSVTFFGTDEGEVITTFC